MTFLYFKLSLVGIIAGLSMLTADLGLQWHGAGVFLAGVVAFWLFIRELQAGPIPEPEPSAGSDKAKRSHAPVSEPHTAPSLPSHHLPPVVDAADATDPCFVVRYGEYLSQMLGGDLATLSNGWRLQVALRVSSGAELPTPMMLQFMNSSCGIDCDYGWYECRLRVSRVNAIALKAVGFRWTAAASHLAEPFAIRPEEVAATQRAMVDLAEQDDARFRRASELLRRIGELGSGSAESEPLWEEFRQIQIDLSAPAANGEAAV